MKNLAGMKNLARFFVSGKTDDILLSDKSSEKFKKKCFAKTLDVVLKTIYDCKRYNKIAREK